MRSVDQRSCYSQSLYTNDDDDDDDDWIMMLSISYYHFQSQILMAVSMATLVL